MKHSYSSNIERAPKVFLKKYEMPSPIQINKSSTGKNQRINGLRNVKLEPILERDSLPPINRSNHHAELLKGSPYHPYPQHHHHKSLSPINNNAHGNNSR
mmetsp:Transcript_10328/g.8887  ORF Transcript_10328/g.8887 Transcript_10328/m.8887 type:complete len:100 (-) Transcript_10328:784-1083(-)